MSRQVLFWIVAGRNDCTGVTCKHLNWSLLFSRSNNYCFGACQLRKILRIDRVDAADTADRFDYILGVDKAGLDVCDGPCLDVRSSAECVFEHVQILRFGLGPCAELA